MDKLKPLALVVLILTACGPKDQNPALETLGRAVADGKYLYGHQDDLCYGKNWKVEDPETDPLLRSDVKDVCGRYPAVVGFDIEGIELDSTLNIDGVPFSLIRRAAAEHYRRGGVVTVSWHARNPLTGGDAWDVSRPGAVASVLAGGENHGKFLGWLDRVADFLSSIKDEDGNAVPILFRPWHENTGNWFWWGARLCTPEDYRNLFILTHDYLVRKGLDNLLWVYSPSGNIEKEKYFQTYPGDDKVDILGLDSYMPGDSDKDFLRQVRYVLGYMTVYAAEHDKLICLSETGYESVPDPAWWTGTLARAVSGFPVCYVLTWRNAWDRPAHYYAPFEGSPDSEDFKAFAASGLPQFID